MRKWHWGSNYAFENNGIKHAAVLLSLAMLAAAIVFVGRRLQPAKRCIVERSAGLLLLGVFLIGEVFAWTNHHASSKTSLPLHWCDLCGALAVLVMFRPRPRALRAILHFWALCICIFAFIVPSIGLGPALRDFWIYFGTHAAIVLTAIYDRCVRGFKPDRHDLLLAVRLAFLWMLILQPIDLALQANYGFVGAGTDVRGAIRALGPWPWRLAPMMGIAAGLMTSLLLAQLAIEKVLAVARQPAITRGLPISFPISTAATTQSALSNAA